MALAFTNLLNEGDTNPEDPNTTAGSITTVAGRLYLATVQITASSPPTLSSITLPGSENMTIHDHVLRSVTYRLYFCYLVAATGGTSTVSLDFSGLPSGLVTILDEVTGQASSSPVVTSNYVEASGTTNPVSVTLPNALADANNAIYAGFARDANTAFTPGTDYTELGDAGHTAPTRRAASEYDVAPGDLVADGDFAASGNWDGFGVEIAVAAGAPAETLHRRRKIMATQRTAPRATYA